MLGKQALNPTSIILSPKLPTYCLTSFDRKVERNVKLYKKFIKHFVEDRIYEIKEGKSKKEDYVSQKYKSVSEEERTPEFIQNLIQDFSTLFIAGTDTTSHSAMMLLYLIMMHPSVQ